MINKAAKAAFVTCHTLFLKDNHSKNEDIPPQAIAKTRPPKKRSPACHHSQRHTSMAPTIPTIDPTSGI
ncbi:hypothetical protein UUU_31240 [Klebsiella pneumoniae subsp. pneumoniae DSM 30104 = JCM 1662 = NBRC 14940]|nr:hypothetical protein UUU_31240 [Klebsiella pneumoniae subsp. pneumoniae DSM 30104 = JCM 1662 = NBRC 14940]